MKSKTEFFYLRGVDFYAMSGTVMSNLYYPTTFTRATFGDVERLVGEGGTVTVRPATDAEELWAFRKLATLQRADARRKAS